jgi:two-component system cell cycle sensor histidine kinase PleC
LGRSLNRLPICSAHHEPAAAPRQINSAVNVSASIEADGAVIAVSDTGIGMKPADIPIALEPFRQIDGALSRRFDGTGLGLPLAKALVELHGGCLDIESAPAAGTVVRIRLPLDRITDTAA